MRKTPEEIISAILDDHIEEDFGSPEFRAALVEAVSEAYALADRYRHDVEFLGGFYKEDDLWIDMKRWNEGRQHDDKEAKPKAKT